MSTVLAIRLRQLGDVLSTLGSMRALKRAAPDRRIVFVADAAYHSLLGRVDFLDELVAGPPKIRGLSGWLEYGEYVDALRRHGASCALDFHSSARTAVLSFLSGAPVRVGFDVRVRKVFYTDVEPRALIRDGRPSPRSSHESALCLVRRAGFEDVDGEAGLTIPTTADDRREGRRLLSQCGIPERVPSSGSLVGLNAGNPYPAKAWPADNFARLSRMLRADGVLAVVLWGPGERETAGRIVEASGGSAHLAAPLSLDQLPGVLKNLDAIVTIDSGLKHLAVAVGTPTVTLFGPTSPWEWHMGGDLDEVVFAGAPCSPCRLRECPFEEPCMGRISPEDVRKSVFRVLEKAAMRQVDGGLSSRG